MVFALLIEINVNITKLFLFFLYVMGKHVILIIHVFLDFVIQTIISRYVLIFNALIMIQLLFKQAVSVKGNNAQMIWIANLEFVAIILNLNIRYVEDIKQIMKVAFLIIIVNLNFAVIMGNALIILEIIVITKQMDIYVLELNVMLITIASHNFVINIISVQIPI